VICDTGSTDKTREIITEFFKEKDIPGELFIEEWKGFGPNKTLMMERAKGKADYILHFDADDILIGDFELNEDKHDAYNARVRRGPTDYVSSILYRGSLLWKFCGVAHTIIKCIDKPYFTTGSLVDLNFYLSSEDVGARSFDPDKYFKYTVGITADNKSRPEKVVLKAENIAAKYIDSQPFHPSQIISKEGKNRTTFEMEVFVSEELIRAILSYGGEVEVVSPQILRERIIVRLKSMNGLYGL
jgi:glycosyltransferase involved in cell wall biosynthesis